MSANDDLLLSTSVDHTARLYDLNDGLPHFVLEHNEPVLCGDISAKFAATGAQSGVVRLWDLSTGACVRSFSGHNDGLVLVAFYRGGLLTASKDETIKLWDLESGDCIETIKNFPGGQTILSQEQDKLYFSRGGEIVALRLSDKTRQLFQSSDDDRQNLLGFVLNGRRLLVSFAKVSNSPSPPFQWFTTFNTETGKEENDQPHRSVSSLLFSPDGEHSISWEDNSARLCNEEKPTQTRSLGAFPERLTCVAFGPNHRLFLGGAGGTLWVLDLSSMAPGTLNTAGTTERLSFVGNSDTLLSFGHDKLDTWNAHTGAHLRDLSIAKLYPTAGVLTADQKTVALLGSKEIACVDLGTGAMTQRLPNKATALRIPQHYLDLPERLLALHKGQSPKRYELQVLALPSFAVISKTLKEVTAPHRFVFLSDENFVVLTEKEYATSPLLLNLKTGELERTFTGHVYAINALLPLPDGRFLSAGQEGNLMLWDYTRETPLATFEAKGAVRGAVLSPDKQAVLSLGYSLRLWSLNQPDKPTIFSGYTTPILCAAFFSNGEMFITGGDDKMLLLWETTKEEPVARYEAPGAIIACAVSSTGAIACAVKTTATNDSNGIIFLQLTQQSVLGSPG
jgi:WD40 repeat protein